MSEHYQPYGPDYHSDYRVYAYDVENGPLGDALRVKSEHLEPAVGALMVFWDRENAPPPRCDIDTAAGVNWNGHEPIGWRPGDPVIGPKLIDQLREFVKEEDLED